MAQISAWRAEAGGLLVAAQPSVHRLVRSGGLDLRLVPVSHFSVTSGLSFLLLELVSSYATRSWDSDGRPNTEKVAYEQ